ncbi:MAG: outer membrane lipid asymmetry maintenance protein MlaD [Deltaproteobacteria bacterium]|nr:outer membrane lipid asymmetry maintenance protein MlaD [Deltaproteobacteria bacterium]
MPRKKLTVEFLVGIFVIIGCLCFAYLAINIARMRLIQTNIYQLTAQFDNISGLTVGAGVEIAGVSIGEVSAIKLSKTNALVTMDINNDVVIRDDDIAAVRTKGIIGEKFVKIIPGGSDTHIKNGDSISDTESTVEFEEIIGKFIHRME